MLIRQSPQTQAGFTEAFLRCDTRCDRRETGKTPNRSHVAPHATAATGPSQAIAEVELGSTFAMRCDATSDLGYDLDLFYSKVVQRFKSCLSICRSCVKPREYHADVPKSAKLCRIADFFCEWYFASSHRTHPSQIASHCVSHRKKASVNPALRSSYGVP